MATEPTSPTRSEAGGPPAKSLSLVLALVCACQFMVILDASIINVALPSVDKDLGFSPTGLAWVVNGYLLTFAGFMLLGGRAADLFGNRRILIAGMFLFSAASLVAGLANSPEVLVVSRIVQGIGAAMLAPSTLVVINTYFTDPAARGKAFGAWAASGGVGGMAGAVVGGALTTGLSWRWVFLINVPIGAVLIAVAVMALTGAQNVQRESLDFVGAITGTVGLAALIYGIMHSIDYGWGSAQVLGPIVGGVVLLIVFFVVEARVAQPMMPLRLYKIRGIAVGNAMLFLFGGLAIAMWYFTSLFLQNVLAYSALQAGLGQTPAAVMFLLVARWAAPKLPKFGVRNLVLAGCAFFLVGFAWLAQAGPDSGYLAAILGPTLLISFGIGLTFPTFMAAATSDAPEGDVGIVGGMANTANQMGGSVGLAVLVTIATARAASEGESTPAALAAGYDLVFLVAAGLGVAIAAVSLMVPKRQAVPA